jgi:hypothetical protein
MKTLTLTLCLLLAGLAIKAQKTDYPTGEKYGNTVNLGIGLGYYSYVGHSMPVLHADYEFDVAKNLTIAPFVSFYTYENYYYWGGPHYPYRNYVYRTTVIPIGAKATYYFDQLLKANSKWDFYLAASLGIAFRKTTWENGYYGETAIEHSTSGLYIDGHIGAEYHMNNKLGLYLDLSTGMSTLGLAIHL